IWRHGRAATDVSSPLYHDGKLYMVNDRGIASCLNGATGETLWQQRVGGTFSSSPVLVGSRIFATDETGNTHVLEVGGGRNERLATNPLNERVLASPAVSGDRLYLRSQQSLWCIDGVTPGQPRVAVAMPAGQNPGGVVFPPGARATPPGVRV